MSLDPRVVAARLAELRVLYRPETVAEAAVRLASDVPRSQPRSFAEEVAERLAELRALDELTRYLHSALQQTE